MTPRERLARLRLARCRGLGPRGFMSLLERAGSAENAFGVLPTLPASVGRPPSETSVEAELDALARLGGTLLVLGEPAYPALLAHIPDPPPVLAVRGDPALLGRPAVALVGARNASAGGCALARTMAGELAAAGLVVVSGLARGIDTAVHEGALAASGLTVAVVANGVDVAYPPGNAALHERIAAEGAVVSERPLGAEARAKDFPRRNRIIAGLCGAVVVVEAAPQSGSLITARLAAEQGREVMAVPGSPLEPRHRGTNALLRDGATLVECSSDVLEAMRGVSCLPVRPRSRPSRPRAPSPVVDPAPAGSPPGHAFLERLGPVPVEVDELIRQSGGDAATVQGLLLDLELDGRLVRLPGGKVALGPG